MKPIVVAYHCCTTLNRDWAFDLIQEQILSLAACGLAYEVSSILVGVNGPTEDAMLVKQMLPHPNAVVVQNVPESWSAGEVPTLQMMAEWIQGYSSCYVLYFHTKGLSFPPHIPVHDHYRDWRLRMENVVLTRWRECVAHLDAGAESVGQWWNVAPNGSYWAGNFFWATSEFIGTLPPINTYGHHSGGRYEAEVWIGRGPRLPNIVSL